MKAPGEFPYYSLHVGGPKNPWGRYHLMNSLIPGRIKQKQQEAPALQWWGLLLGVWGENLPPSIRLKIFRFVYSNPKKKSPESGRMKRFVVVCLFLLHACFGLVRLAGWSEIWILQQAFIHVNYTPEVQYGTWKSTPGKGDSFWRFHHFQVQC